MLLFPLISNNLKPRVEEHQAPLGHGHALSLSPTGYAIYLKFCGGAVVAWPSSPGYPFVLLFQTTRVY